MIRLKFQNIVGQGGKAVLINLTKGVRKGQRLSETLLKDVSNILTIGEGEDKTQFKHVVSFRVFRRSLFSRIFVDT